jgi:hypothetical protein
LVYEFPEKLLGTYINKDNDTLQINKHEFKYGNKKNTFFHLNLSLKSKGIELKKFNDYYILNSNEEGLWNIIPFIYDKGKIVVYYINIEENTEKEIIGKLKGITSVKEIKNNDNKITKYIINPSNKELQKMFNKKVFSEVFVFEKIK